MGCLLKTVYDCNNREIIVSCYGTFSWSILMISIVVKFVSCWSLSLNCVSTLIFFTVYFVIFNNLSVFVLTLLNWLYRLRTVLRIVFCGGGLNVVWWPELYNDVCYLVFFKWQDQKLLQTIFWHWEFYITFYRSGVSEHCDVGEHVGVWSPVKFCSANFDGSWMKFVALVST